MKPLYSAIAVSLIVASVAVPMHASADEAHSSAWSRGYADALKGESGEFNNPYSAQDDRLVILTTFVATLWANQPATPVRFSL